MLQRRVPTLRLAAAALTERPARRYREVMVDRRRIRRFFGFTPVVAALLALSFAGAFAIGAQIAPIAFAAIIGWLLYGCSALGWPGLWFAGSLAALWLSRFAGGSLDVLALCLAAGGVTHAVIHHRAATHP